MTSSWKKYVRTVNPFINSNYITAETQTTTSSAVEFNSLRMLYKGHPNRFQRYKQFDDMANDSTITIALNTISDFCTQSEEHSIDTFFIDYDSSVTESEISIISKSLKRWVALNDFTNRIWNIFKNTLQKGDEFFVVHPETLAWLWIDPYTVEEVEFAPDEMNKILYYHIRGLSPILAAKTGATKSDRQNRSMTDGLGSQNSFNTSVFQLNDIATPLNQNGMQNNDNTVYRVDAKYVVHISQNNGMDKMWPFGKSILESVYQTYKQKQLVEDAVLIYRVQYAPVRRVFNIDTGSMKPVESNAYVERIKNENHQRRMAGKNGLMDAAYNPLSMMEDYYFAVGENGRKSSVELLSGGDQVGEITDLQYWDKKLRDGLGIPSSYMPGVENQSTHNDGKVGAALVQEQKFNKFCIRVQNAIIKSFDVKFKEYLAESGINVDEFSFSLKFNPPMNFMKYRQIEIDSAQMGVYTQIADNKKLSERFKLMRFLNLTQEEIAENERLWMEENPTKVLKAIGSEAKNDKKAGLDDVGFSEDAIDSGEQNNEDLGNDGGQQPGDDISFE